MGEKLGVISLVSGNKRGFKSRVGDGGFEMES